MKILSRIILLTGVLLISGLVIPSAEAACTDPARPGADWRRCYFDERNFGNVDLTGSHLRDSRFIRAKLAGANLSKVDAHRAKFISAIVTGVRFDGARLTEVDFTRAILSKSTFRKADLRRARFVRANLRGADLSGAKLKGADLLGADLSRATWIDGKTICAEGSLGQCN
jgi:uncharacterized protein YjbI with pentapeptide repeats